MDGEFVNVLDVHAERAWLKVPRGICYKLRESIILNRITYADKNNTF